MNDRVPLQKPKEEQAKQHQTEEQVLKDNRIGVLSFMDDLSYHSFAESLDIPFQERNDNHLAEKLSFLTDWAKNQTKSDDRLQHQLAIKGLVRSLGYQVTGKELVDKLFRWTRLDQDRKRIEQKMEVL